jgi:hypothetical protein
LCVWTIVPIIPTTALQIKVSAENDFVDLVFITLQINGIELNNPSIKPKKDVSA